MQSDDVKYIKLVNNMLLEDLQRLPEKLSWAKSVKVLLESLEFGHVWLMQGVGDVTMFLNVFKQRLTDYFIQGWNAEISNSSRANTYRLMADFNFKCYLDFITIRMFPYAFTRLRVASHRLEIEAGRLHKPNRILVEEIVFFWKMNSTFYWNVLCIKIYIRYILNVIFGQGQMNQNLSSCYNLIMKIL